jgi:predicted enzyme related to lactoylglutathione lyase
VANSSKAQFAFALEYTSDLAAARRFFTNVLGIEVEREAPHFVQFKGGNGASYALADDEPLDPSQHRAIELWWQVEDADAAFREMSAHAAVTVPLKNMPFGTCFGIKDPSGQIHYVLQFAAARPSQAVA